DTGNHPEVKAETLVKKLQRMPRGHPESTQECPLSFRRAPHPAAGPLAPLYSAARMPSIVLGNGTTQRKPTRYERSSKRAALRCMRAVGAVEKLPPRTTTESPKRGSVSAGAQGLSCERLSVHS